MRPQPGRTGKSSSGSAGGSAWPCPPEPRSGGGPGGDSHKRGSRGSQVALLTCWAGPLNLRVAAVPAITWAVGSVPRGTRRRALGSLGRADCCSSQSLSMSPVVLESILVHQGPQKAGLLGPGFRWPGREPVQPEPSGALGDFQGCLVVLVLESHPPS